MNLRIKSFLMISLLVIALQAFPRSLSAEGYADESVEPEKSEYCYTINDDGSENIIPCPNQTTGDNNSDDYQLNEAERANA
jgi:hypothetical protein